MRKAEVATLLLLVGALCVGVTPALQAQGVNPQSLYGRDTTQGVFVRDSAVAVEKFALAERMEHLKEWDKSADVYMEILRSYADRVVPSQIDKENKIYQYTSVTPAVQERLAKWPEEGLAVYRARYEAEASGLLESANDDPGQLHRVFSTYFVTDAAKRAGVRLSDLYFERGEFAAGAWIGDRLLGWHPGLGDDRAKLLYRTALAYHLAGNDNQAQQRLAELKEKFPEAAATVRGQQVLLGESLANELLARTASATRDGLSDSWPMPFGSPDRARVPGATTFGGARLFSIDIDRSPVRLQAPQLRELATQNQLHRAAGMMTGIFPVVDRGELFFQDNARVYAVSIESGTPLPGWAESWDGDRNGRFTINAWPTPRCQQQTVAVTDDSVLAIMGQNDYLAMSYAGNFGNKETRLVCLDRRSGKPRWVAQPRQSLPESLRNLDFTGSPLVVGDTVYLQARGGKGMQFEDAYVLAFDLGGGNFRWACYVSSANSTSPFDGDIGQMLAQNVSHLAYSSGRLYALTNLGALAAIDAYDGTIVWLNIYPRDIMDAGAGRNFGLINWQRQMRGGGGSSPNTDKPWSYNPVIVTQQKVFTLPSDGLFVHVYDAGSGVEVKRIKLSEFGNCDTMLGVVDDRLVLTSDRQVVCVNWKAYQPNSPQSKVDEEFKFWDYRPQRRGQPEDSIRGRGVVTADSVIIPTAWQLLRIALRNGAVLQLYPPAPSNNWGEDEGPGNVLVTGDRLILAGPAAAGAAMRVSVYTDLAMAMAKLDAAVAAAPDDAAPRLRYAEIMFVAGKLDVAVAKLDEAIGLVSGTSGSGAGGATGTRDPATRDRVFNAALSFAQKLVKDNRPETGDIAAGLFDRAAATASTPSQKVNYRLNRAVLLRQRGQAGEEIKLYQQILGDPELRGVPVADVNGDTTAVSAVAKSRINEAIGRGGTDAYAPFEQAAKEMLSTASSAHDPEQLQNLAQVYPNSSAAPKALMLAAEIYELNNDPRRATQVLRQAYFGYPSHAERHQMLEAMARCYLLMPGRIDVAIARLTQGARLGGSPKLTRPLVLPDGRRIEKGSFSQAAEALRQYRQLTSARDLPDIALPPLPRKLVPAFLPEAKGTVVAGVGALLVPSVQFARHDRVVTFSPGGGLRVYAVGGAQPLFTCDAITQPPREVAWVNGTLLVWAQREVTQLAESGQVLWRMQLADVPQVEVVAQGGAGGSRGDADGADDGRPLAGGGAVDGDVIVAGNGGRLIIRNGQQIIIAGGGGVIVRGGRVVGGALAQQQAMLLAQQQQQQALQQQQQDPNAKPAAEQIVQVRPLTDRLILGTSTGRIIALDLANGKTLWQSRLSDRAATHLLASDDFVVTRAADETGTSVQLAVFDTFTGQVLSRRPYGNDPSNQSLAPVNLALSPDGRLIVLMPDRICGKDLFEPGGLDKMTFDNGGKTNDNSFPYITSVTPEHLQISGDCIFVIAENNTSVRVHSLQNGQLVKQNSSNAIFPTGVRQTPANVINMANAQVQVRVVGSVLYITTNTDIKRFELGSQHTWTMTLNNRTSGRLRDLQVAQAHTLVFLEQGSRERRGPNPQQQPQPQPQPQQPPVSMRLCAFSRANSESGTESGFFEYDTEISDLSGIQSWQVVDGGLYYLGGDGRLHFLRGARATEEKPRT